MLELNDQEVKTQRQIYRVGILWLKKYSTREDVLKAQQLSDKIEDHIIQVNGSKVPGKEKKEVELAVNKEDNLRVSDNREEAAQTVHHSNCICGREKVASER